MINLLPPKEKTILSLEQKKKMVVILWLLFLFFIVCFILILLSIKFYLQEQVEYQKIILEETKERIEQSEIKNLQEEFNSFNILLTKLNSFYQQKVYFGEVLEETSKILPKEAYLTNISATKGEASVIQIALSGFIPTRESLFEFKKNLEKEKSIKEVSFPPTNWVNSVDINFFVTFKIPKD